MSIDTDRLVTNRSRRAEADLDKRREELLGELQRIAGGGPCSSRAPRPRATAGLWDQAHGSRAAWVLADGLACGIRPNRSLRRPGANHGRA